MNQDRIRIRLAVQEDMTAIMSVFAQARAAIAALGIDQWQDGYPTEAHIGADIEKGYAYVLCTGGTVQGYFAMIGEPEPTYARIYDGAWLTDGAYTTVHRVAMSDALRGKGGAAFSCRFCIVTVDYHASLASDISCRCVKNLFGIHQRLAQLRAVA
jgi:hypothetical protein